MTDWRVAVLALRIGRTWEQAAVLCNGKRLKHPGSYYQRIASGNLKMPHLAARNGIRRAVAKHAAYALTAVNGTSKPVRPLGVSISRPLGPGIAKWAKRHSMTWDQWATKADALMRREFGD